MDLRAKWCGIGISAMLTMQEIGDRLDSQDTVLLRILLLACKGMVFCKRNPSLPLLSFSA